MVNKTCENCAHWDWNGIHTGWNNGITLQYCEFEDDDDYDNAEEAVNANLGTCQKIKPGWDLTLDQAKAAQAVVRDGSGYSASLHTRATFSCIEFTPKTQGETP